MLDGVRPEGEIGDFYFTWQGERYIGMSFVIPLSERDRLTLSNAYGTLRTQEPIRGEWKLPFTMENLPALELALSDVEGAILPDTLVLSPLGAMLLGDIEAQFRGTIPLPCVCRTVLGWKISRNRRRRCSPTNCMCWVTGHSRSLWMWSK